MHFIKKYVLLTLILSLSFSGMSQPEGDVFRLSESGYSQIKNETHLLRHYIDSTSGLYRERIRAGLSHNLNEVQLKLGYFNLLIHDTLVYYDVFFLGLFDSLAPEVIQACKDFGFYQFVSVLEEIAGHRNKSLSAFQSDTTSTIFNENHADFDRALSKLRGKLALIRDEFVSRGIYLDRLRSYMIENKHDIVR